MPFLVRLFECDFENDLCSIDLQEEVIYESTIIHKDIDFRLSHVSTILNEPNLPFEAYKGSSYAFAKLQGNESALTKTMLDIITHLLLSVPIKHFNPRN